MLYGFILNIQQEHRFKDFPLADIHHLADDLDI